MNRGLYRGKRSDTDDWIYGFYAKSGDKAYIIKDNDIAIGYLTMKEVAPETVCEFTGLYTAEGAEIYENDICRFDDRNFIVKRECDIPGGNWMETGFALKEIGYADYCGNGKVIGEFVCDKISEIGFSPWSHGEYVSDIENLHKASCLNFDEMFSYLEDGVGYGWHISSLKIYDKPRELSEFGRGCDAENINEIRCRDCKKLVSFDDICEVMCKPLNRPPQSWCYVEVYK